MSGMLIGRGLWVLKLSAVVIPIVASLIWGWLLFQNVERTARSEVEVQARLLSQHLEGVIESQQVLHKAIESRLTVEAPGFAASEGLNLFLRDVAQAYSALDGLLLVDTEGRVVADSRRFPARGTRVPADVIAPLHVGEAAWISRQVQGGSDHLVVATPVSGAGFHGFALSMLQSTSIQDYLRTMAVRPGEAASISRRDGMLLLRNFAATPVLLPPEAPGRLYPLLARSGSFKATAVTDGITRIYGFHWTNSLPIFVNFGMPMGLVWQDWGRQFVPLMVLFMLVGLLIWAMGDRVERTLTLREKQEEDRKRVETAEMLADQRINLMREMNHRVKNNLALVVSLISLQAREGKGVDPESLKARIGAISHVHDLMHQAADAVHVDFATMLADIAGSQAMIPVESGITVHSVLQPGILLGPDRITALSVIAAELITNAVKHAFTGRLGGTIRIRLYREGDTVVLVIADNGVGLSRQSTRRSGKAIVEALVEQIGGELSYETNCGVTSILRFPL